MACAIVWFRQDLRLADNPALSKALQTCERVVPLYILSPAEAGEWRPGAASNWWLHHSLSALDGALRELGSRLILRQGGGLETLLALAREIGDARVFWNRVYEPALIERDKTVKRVLREQGIEVLSSNSALLFEPWALSKADGGCYRVFTPFWKACLRGGLPEPLHAHPAAMPPVPPEIRSLPLEELGLLPTVPWDGGLRHTWRVGEAAAQASLDRFLDEAVHRYPEDRNRPDLTGTSRLSPHLHFGEIGPRQVAQAVERLVRTRSREGLVKGSEVFLSEIGWREFAYHLLYHFPHTTDAPLDERFAVFPWAEDEATQLAAWRSGNTGIPMVDAGMRELWRTGWMHNRVRMVVASFLTKNLLVPWQQGARWFWDTLVDADLASNTLGWQWTAGCGADAAPYFRIFNPVLQGERFDPRGDYVRRWIPELQRLPDRLLHRPWEAPAEVLRQAGIRLGEDYAAPLVDLHATRARALERFARIASPASP